MNEKWQALAREAGLAAEHLAIGASALGKANYAQHAYYGQAFFALTIGMERAAKLALVVDYALEHNGEFPNTDAVTKHRHDVAALLKQADEIARRRKPNEVQEYLPQSEIHSGIVKVLSDFATNITRYYNLNLVTGDPRTSKIHDPVRAWFDLVIVPVLAGSGKTQ
jgi:hypothetical protein